jgi:hypothetical protein
LQNSPIDHDETNHRSEADRPMQTLQTRPLAGTLAGQAVVSRSRSSADLTPKEHGAYAILAIPMIAALAVGGTSQAGWCIVLAAVAGFFAHEPLLIILGHRGRRVYHANPRAKPLLAVLLGVMLISSGVAFAWSGFAGRVAVVACLLAAGIIFSIALLGKHRTLAGQLCGVAGLSAPCLPILLAGGVDVWPAVEFWLTWLIGFSCTTVAVRGVIAVQKCQPTDLMWIVLIALSLLVAINALGPLDLALATLPMIAISWYLMLRPPPTKYLKRVGWSLVAGTAVTALLVITLSPAQ